MSTRKHHCYYHQEQCRTPYPRMFSPLLWCRLLFMLVVGSQSALQGGCKISWSGVGSCDCKEGLDGLHLSCKKLNSTDGFPRLARDTLSRVSEINIRDSWDLLCLESRHLSQLSGLRRVKVTRGGLRQLFCDTEESDRGLLKKWETLHVTFTKLKTLQRDHLKRFPNIKQLNLSNNKLEHLSHRVFRDLQQVDILDISNNLLDERLEKETLEGVTENIKHLDISGNFFQCSPDLSWLHLWSKNFNRNAQKILSKAKCYILNSPTGQHSPLFKVMEVYHSQVTPSCPLSCSCHFYHFVHIDSGPPEYTVMVNCSGRGLSTFPSLPPRTIVLDMSHNKLSQEAYPNLDIVGQQYQQLSGLNLSHNQLTSLDTKLMRLKLHRSFTADHNQLTDMPYDLSLSLQKYHNQVKLGNNPWKCQCNAEITDRSLLEKIQDIDSVVCAKGSVPKSISGTQLMKVDRLLLCPSSHKSDPKEDMLKAVCGCLAAAILLIMAKLSYDFWQYRNKGKLPSIVYMMP